MEVSHCILLSPVPSSRDDSSETVKEWWVEPAVLLYGNDDLRMIFWWGYRGTAFWRSYCMFYRGTGVSVAPWSLCGQYAVGFPPQDETTLILKMLLRIFLSTFFTYFIPVSLLLPMRRKYVVKFNQVKKTKKIFLWICSVLPINLNMHRPQWTLYCENHCFKSIVTLLYRKQ